MNEQIRLLQIAMKLKPGQAINIPRSNMRKAAYSGAYREATDTEVSAFIAQIRNNWDVKLTEEPITGNWKMEK